MRGSGVARRHGDSVGSTGGQIGDHEGIGSTKLQIAALGVDSLKLVSLEKPVAERQEADDLFIHSTMFVLMDKQARMRGIYETGGDGVEWTNVQPSILAAIRQLENEK